MRLGRLGLGLPAATLVAVLVLAGCGGGASDDGPASAAPAQDTVIVTPETAATPFTLQKGIYRLTWTTDCTNVSVTVTSDSGFNKSKTSGIANFSWILTGVTPGTYTVSQTDPACTKWSIEVDKVGS